jgi:hypothetical protein
MAKEIGPEQKAKYCVGARSDKLVSGAIDIHCHAYPEVSFEVRRTLQDWETIEIARDEGMRAIVLKSHLWPTVDRAHYLRHMVPGIEVFGSISLNPSSGGLSPWAVESALMQGAKIIWMPTWSSVHDWTHGLFSGWMKGWLSLLREQGLKEPLSILDSKGGLRNEVRTILTLAKEYKACISTGHIAIDESLTLAQVAGKVGFTKLVFGHPLSRVVNANMDQIREMANQGAYIELCALNVFLSSARDTLLDMVDVIDQVGPERCILSTDSFYDWVPSPPHFLRMFVGHLMLFGVSEENLRTMVQHNPAQLLDLPPIEREDENI